VAGIVIWRNPARARRRYSHSAARHRRARPRAEPVRKRSVGSDAADGTGRPAPPPVRHDALALLHQDARARGLPQISGLWPWGPKPRRKRGRGSAIYATRPKS